MGQKVNPKSYRIITTKQWLARWFDPKNLAEKLHEDISIRETIYSQFGPTAGIGAIEIERDKTQVTVFINTAKPGIIIGRSGKGIEQLRQILHQRFGHPVRLEIIEIKKPELDAAVIAQSIGHQIEKRINHRRAGRQAVDRAMQAGAKGIKIIISGRLRGADIARQEKFLQGSVPLANLRSRIEYGLCHAKTSFGVIGVKVWVNHGQLIQGDQHAAAA